MVYSENCMSSSDKSERIQMLIAAVFDEFCERDYAECCQHVAELDDLRAFRGMPFYLVGIDLAPDREPSLQVILVSCIAFIRLGQLTLADNILQIRTIGGPGWVDSLLKLVLDQTTMNEVLRVTETDAQRVQVHYYEAERLLTGRDFAAALRLFQRCLELPGTCPERRFAIARIDWLQDRARVLTM
jgi:hypothetical protein